VISVAVIPARYASTRLPGKPLLNRTGKYLIEHVYEQVSRARRLSKVIIATDDRRIYEAVESFGGCAAMTRDDHVSGTDRVAEVAAAMNADIVVNVQGDEPEIEPDNIDRLVDLLAQSHDCDMATLACPFPAGADPADPNAVKVVVDAGGRAIYFSRSPIPYPRDDKTLAAHRDAFLLHIGIYAYRREFLLRLATWPAGRLERIEKLEQLRVLERRVGIAVGLVERAAVGIDTPADYEAFVKRIQTAAP
jgi:3-deoxy-manno-octulosonate cytidylyltransferase (CMP-KDO synthetase)